MRRNWSGRIAVRLSRMRENGASLKVFFSGPHSARDRRQDLAMRRLHQGLQRSSAHRLCVLQLRFQPFFFYKRHHLSRLPSRKHRNTDFQFAVMAMETRLMRKRGRGSQAYLSLPTHSSRKRARVSRNQRRKLLPPTRLLDLPDEAISRIVAHIFPFRSVTPRTQSAFQTIIGLAYTSLHMYQLVRNQMKRSCQILDMTYSPRQTVTWSPFVPPVLNIYMVSIALEILGPILKIVCLPPIRNVQLCRDLGAAIAFRCPNLREMEITEGGSLTVPLAKYLLDHCSKLRKIMISYPGPELLTALGMEPLNGELEDISFLNLNPDYFNLIIKVLEKRGRCLRSFCLSFNFDARKSTELQHDIISNQIRLCLDSICINGRRYMPHLLFLKIILDVHGAWILLFLRKISKTFLSGSNINVVVFGLPVAIQPRQTDPMWAQQLSVNANFMFTKSSAHVRSIFERGVLQPRVLDISNEKSMLAIYRTSPRDMRMWWSFFMGFAKPYVRTVRVHRAFGHRNDFRNMCRCLTDLLSFSSKITTLEVSREMVAYSSVQEEHFMKMFDACTNIRVLHLSSPENHSLTHYPRVGNVRVINHIPAFLQLLTKKCPQLETLYFENAGKMGDLKDLSKLIRPIRKALSAVHSFETLGKFRNATTLKSQLVLWLSQCSP